MKGEEGVGKKSPLLGERWRGGSTETGKDRSRPRGGAIYGGDADQRMGTAVGGGATGIIHHRGL